MFLLKILGYFSQSSFMNFSKEDTFQWSVTDTDNLLSAQSVFLFLLLKGTFY